VGQPPTERFGHTIVETFPGVFTLFGGSNE